MRGGLRSCFRLKQPLATGAAVLMAEKKHFVLKIQMSIFNLGIAQHFCPCTILVSTSGKNSLMPLHHIDIHYV